MALLLSNCTRKAETTRFSLTFPATSQSKSSVLAQADAGVWNSAITPTALSEINCYVVFVDSPALPTYAKCSNAAGSEIIRGGVMRGMYSAGSTAKIDVPASANTRILIAGFKSSSGACETIADGTSPTFNNYSYPYLLATETKDLSPGPQEVNITLQANFNEASRVENCDIDSMKPVQSAPLVIGQFTPNTIAQARHGLSSNVRGMFQSGGKTFISDCGLRRVLIFNSPPTSNQSVADLVLGQPGINSTETGGPTASSMNCATGVHYDGTRLFISDSLYHRVMIWNSFPTANNQPANVVIGQSNFTAVSSNGGTSVGASGLNSPYSVTTSGSKMIVADKMNNRVLIWNSIPTVNGVAADVVVGQTSMTSGAANYGGISAAFLSSPAHVAVDSGDLWVTDVANNRVLKYNGIPTTNGEAASLVVGQPGFSTSSAACTSSGLSSPNSVAFSGGKLLINDTGNHRVAVFNSVPVSNGATMDTVLGQSATSGACSLPASITADTFQGSTTGTIAAFNGGVSLANAPKYRIMVWNSLTGTNKAPADWVYGQRSLTEAVSINGLLADDMRLYAPYGAISDDNQLAVADSANNRVLIWNSVPFAHGGPAHVAIGQTSMSGTAVNIGIGTSSPTSASLYNPTGLLVHEGKLFVADKANNRVLIWNSVPATTGAPADMVLGQSVFTSSVAGTSSTRMSAPTALAVNDTKLAVVETGNNRVLLFNLPVTSNASAVNVAGQTSMSLGISGGCTASGLSAPMGVAVTNNKMIVADMNNNRVVIYDLNSFNDGAAAVTVLGQPNATTCTVNTGGLTASSMNQPRGVAIDKNGRLFVADTLNNRILMWNSIPTSNVPADLVLGQPDMVSNLENNGGVSVNSLSSPTAIHFTKNQNMWITDTGNQRIIRRALP